MARSLALNSSRVISPSKPGSTHPAFWINRPSRPMELRPSTKAVRLSADGSTPWWWPAQNCLGATTNPVTGDSGICRLAAHGKRYVRVIRGKIRKGVAQADIHTGGLDLLRRDRLNSQLTGRHQGQNRFVRQDHGCSPLFPTDAAAFFTAAAAVLLRRDRGAVGQGRLDHDGAFHPFLFQFTGEVVGLRMLPQ